MAERFLPQAAPKMLPLIPSPAPVPYGQNRCRLTQLSASVPLTAPSSFTASWLNSPKLSNCASYAGRSQAGKYAFFACAYLLPLGLLTTLREASLARFTRPWVLFSCLLSCTLCTTQMQHGRSPHDSLGQAPSGNSMTSYWQQKPLKSNSTVSGRGKNTFVSIVFARGAVRNPAARRKLSGQVAFPLK